MSNPQPNHLDNFFDERWQKEQVDIHRLARSHGNKKRASYKLKTLFSSQFGSWPFETIARNGLFKLMAQHQPSHPKAIWVEDCKISLASLRSCISNKNIIESNGINFVIKYPIVINNDAVLDLSGTHLILSADLGAAMINLGTVIGVDSRLSGSNSRPKINRANYSLDELRNKNHSSFRPFILSWGGGKLFFQDSTFTSLGYNKRLSGGITITLSKHQNSLDGESLAYFDNVVFEDIYEPIRAEHTQLVVKKSELIKSGNTGIAAKHSYVLIEDTKIRNASGYGVKMKSPKATYIANNTISTSGLAGIQVDDLSNKTYFFRNTIKSNQKDAVVIKGVATQKRQKSTIDKLESSELVMLGNQLNGNSRDGLFVKDVNRVVLIDNTFADNGRYGINQQRAALPAPSSTATAQQVQAQNDSSSPAASTATLVNNRFLFNTKAALKSINIPEIGFSNNQFKAHSPHQRALVGDLLAAQAELLPKIASATQPILFKAR